MDARSPDSIVHWVQMVAVNYSDVYAIKFEFKLEAANLTGVLVFLLPLRLSVSPRDATERITFRR